MPSLIRSVKNRQNLFYSARYKQMKRYFQTKQIKSYLFVVFQTVLSEMLFSFRVLFCSFAFSQLEMVLLSVVILMVKHLSERNDPDYYQGKIFLILELLLLGNTLDYCQPICVYHEPLRFFPKRFLSQVLQANRYVHILCNSFLSATRTPLTIRLF